MDTSSLMKKILSKDNLNAAYLQVVRNKGAAGIYEMTVEKLGVYLSGNGENIREQLRTRKHKPQLVRRVEIPKEGESGVRKLEGGPRWVAFKIAYCGDRYARLAITAGYRKQKKQEIRRIRANFYCRLLHH